MNKKRKQEEFTSNHHNDDNDNVNINNKKIKHHNNVNNNLRILSADITAASELDDEQDKYIAFNIINFMLSSFFLSNNNNDDVLHSIDQYEEYYIICFDKFNLKDDKNVSLLSLQPIIKTNNSNYIREIYIYLDDRIGVFSNLYTIQFVVMKNEYVKNDNGYKYKSKSLINKQLTNGNNNNNKKEPQMTNVTTKKKMEELRKQLKSTDRLDEFPSSFHTSDHDINTIDEISKMVNNMFAFIPKIHFELSLTHETRYIEYLLEFDGVSELEYNELQKIYSKFNKQIKDICIYGSGHSTRKLIISLVPFCSIEEFAKENVNNNKFFISEL